MFRGVSHKEELSNGCVLMGYICTHPLHRGWRVGREIGDLPLDKCLKADCDWLAVENEGKSEDSKSGHL